MATVPAFAQTVVDFEELNAFNPPDPEVFNSGDFFDGYGAAANSDGFTSQSVIFTTNQFGPGFSYSKVTDSDTPGFFNQFAAYPAPTAASGSNYGIVNTGSGTLIDGTPTNGASLNFSTKVSLSSIDIANTTYAARYILDGLDGISPQSGFDFEADKSADFLASAQFSDRDFFRLFIAGFDGTDGTGNQTGSLTYDLANYFGPGAGDDEFLDDWTTLDLSSFGTTRSLRFSTTSSQISDFGGFGIFSDVPAYAAIDNLTFTTAVPEPNAVIVLLGFSGYMTSRRRRKA
jgi:hypothetical protein